MTASTSDISVLHKRRKTNSHAHRASANDTGPPLLESTGDEAPSDRASRTHSSSPSESSRTRPLVAGIERRSSRRSLSPAQILSGDDVPASATSSPDDMFPRSQQAQPTSAISSRSDALEAFSPPDDGGATTKIKHASALNGIRERPLRRSGRARPPRNGEISSTHVASPEDESSVDLSAGALSRTESTNSKPTPREVVKRDSSLANGRSTRANQEFRSQKRQQPVARTKTSVAETIQAGNRSSRSGQRRRRPSSDTLSTTGTPLTNTFSSAASLHYTNYTHLPANSKHASIEEYLDSFISLDEDFPRDMAEHGRLRLAPCLQLHSSQPRDTNVDQQMIRSSEPHTATSHVHHIAAQGKYFSKLMQDERKRNYTNARKIAGMVQAHFKKLSGASERHALDHERSMRQLAKRTANEIKRKWRSAEKEVQRRLTEKLQNEQRAAGKLHLREILNHSTNLLDSRRRLESENEFDDDDHYLSVEQLKLKYANLPELDHPDSTRSRSHSLSGSMTSTNGHDCRSSTAIDDDSPMDSELDSEVGDTSDSEEESDDPSLGLASLYPELARKASDLVEQTTREDDSPCSPQLNLADPAVKPKQKEVDNLAQLNSDDEIHEFDPDSPMDSELDEAGSDESDLDASQGPGLAWLYGIGPNKLQAASPDLTTPTKSIQNMPTEVISGVPFPFDPSAAELVMHKKDPLIPAPVLLRGTLREYQRVGLNWLSRLYRDRTNGILADEMGLGKTIQTISLLAWLACDQEIWGPHLIIVPTSVMLNWEVEFKKFAPALKVLTYYGSPKERKEKRRGWSRPDFVDVVITSYQLVVTDAVIFRRKRWHYMILDEAHNIKNFKSQRWQTLLNFNTEHRLLLTGTPLQNNLNELWSLLYFLMPQGLGNNAAFANLSDFQEWFVKPVDSLVENPTHNMDEEARETVAKLHRILRPYILRRLKADVEKQMPGKYEHVITCRLSKRQRYLYDDFMSRSGTQAIMASGNFLSIINCFMQLRKVCNHPDLFESRPIRTSLAIQTSVCSSFCTAETSIRRHLIKNRESEVDLDFLGLRFVHPEYAQSLTADRIADLAEDFSFRLKMAESVIATTATTSTTMAASLAQDDSRHRPPRFNSQWLAASQNLQKLQHLHYVNQARCHVSLLYSASLVQLLRQRQPEHNSASAKLLSPTFEAQVKMVTPIVSKFACITPKVFVLNQSLLLFSQSNVDSMLRGQQFDDLTHFARTAATIAFPDKRLLQYDCGKLQRLESLLRQLISQGHRVLIFTQMTRMLDVLEQFLNIHGYLYFRLDGSTKIEARQTLTERFNSDIRIPIFILSTRSGGLGINLTGADTVIFYDSDWNPSMDRQCQDRAHRIGQTRDVHIYRFVSEYTIEQNIMRKANQKRVLDNVVIGEGDFTTEYFDKMDWKDMLSTELAANISHPDDVDLSQAFAAAEDEDDAKAAVLAERELDDEALEFDENAGNDMNHAQATMPEVIHGSRTLRELGSVDDYMIAFIEREWSVMV